MKSAIASLLSKIAASIDIAKANIIVMECWLHSILMECEIIPYGIDYHNTICASQPVH